MLFPEPVSIKLSIFEARHVNEYLQRQSLPDLTPDVRNEVIILAEYWQKFSATFFLHVSVKPKKEVRYKIPLSICRILHIRLRYQTNTQENLSVLAKLDQQLVNRGCRPPEIVPIV